MIKAIFFDIDGTLVSFKTHCIPNDALDALRQLKKKGILLFVATGRHKKEAENVLDNTLFDGYVTLNGQYCFTKETVIRQAAMDPGDLAILIEGMAKDPYPCEFVGKDGFFINFITDIVLEAHNAVNIPLPPVRDAREALKEEIFQLTAFFPPEREAEIMAPLRHTISTRWSDRFADVVPREGGKGEGVAAMCAHFGIRPDEIMAFGDGENDITMIQYAGIGVAMGNSGQAVKDSADYVTDAVERGGIRKALNHFGI